jgi:hypothetical protein
VLTQTISLLDEDGQAWVVPPFGSVTAPNVDSSTTSIAVIMGWRARNNLIHRGAHFEMSTHGRVTQC